jgi:hypothetical protein
MGAPADNVQVTADPTAWYHPGRAVAFVVDRELPADTLLRAARGVDCKFVTEIRQGRSRRRRWRKAPALTRAQLRTTPIIRPGPYFRGNSSVSARQEKPIGPGRLLETLLLTSLNVALEVQRTPHDSQPDQLCGILKFLRTGIPDFKVGRVVHHGSINFIFRRIVPILLACDFASHVDRKVL